MPFPVNLLIDEFNYLLPPEKIAQFPLPERDSSKLVIWREGKINESVFKDADRELPDNCILVFNETKVIRARLIFTKNTGATIEIFCLEPVSPTAEIQVAFQQKGFTTWCCLVGNSKRWKTGILKKEMARGNETCILNAEKGEDLGDGHFLINFSWNPDQMTFSEILEISGRIPLPPYINRGDTPLDSFRYQTIFAKQEGSVAAPTAGLHFTEETIQKLQRKNIIFEKIALHVGVGTFRPVSHSAVSQHLMHSEKFEVSLNTLKSFIDRPDKQVIATGTTTVRTLESLYWLGVKLCSHRSEKLLHIGQWDPYTEEPGEDIPAAESLKVLVRHMEKHNLDRISGSTELMIVPGYRFRMTDGMFTNFHLPQSTLLLLVAAFIGDAWKDVYQYALNNGFRFLSYGDSCLFFPAGRSKCSK